MKQGVTSGDAAPEWLSRTPAVLIIFSLWLALVIYQGWTRSGWLDEFFMGVVTDPHVSWSEHLPSWQAEPHPPAYSVMLWAYRHLVDFGSSMFALRSLSIIVSVVLSLGALAFWRACKWPGLALFAFFLFTSPVMEFYPQETRSYFLAAFGGLYASLYLLRAFEAETSDKPRLRDVVLGVVAAALLSTHLISIAFAGLLFGVSVIFMIVEKRWAWLKVTLLIGVFVMGPALATIAFTILGTLATTVKSFWITRWEVILTAAALPLATGAPVLLTLAYALWRRKDIRGRRERTAAGIALAVVGSVLILGLVSIIRPILVLRYLTAPMAALAPVAAILAFALVPWSRVQPSRWVAGVGCIVIMALGLYNGGLNPNSDWLTPAKAVNAAPSCAGAEIAYLILKHEPDPDFAWSPNFEWYAPGHKYVAAIPSNQQRIAEQACSVKLWAAHSDPNHVPEGHSQSLTRACSGRPATALIFIDGYLIVDDSDQRTITTWPGPKVSCEMMLRRVPRVDPAFKS